MTHFPPCCFYPAFNVFLFCFSTHLSVHLTTAEQRSTMNIEQILAVALVAFDFRMYTNAWKKNVIEEKSRGASLT